MVISLREKYDGEVLEVLKMEFWSNETVLTVPNKIMTMTWYYFWRTKAGKHHQRLDVFGLQRGISHSFALHLTGLLKNKALDGRLGRLLPCGLVIRVLELSGNLATSTVSFQNLCPGQSGLDRRMPGACRNHSTLHRQWVAKHLCAPTLLFSLEPPLVSIMTSTGRFEGSSIHYRASHSIISDKGTLGTSEI